VNILGLEITAKSGKLNWMNIRRFCYVLVIVWLLGVRLANVNPFDDFGREGGVGLDTLLDAFALYGIWLIVWHVLWSLRPRFG
jgi:hypothetical protein